MFRAIGFEKRRVQSYLVREYVILLLTGTLLGGLSALIATMPSLLEGTLRDVVPMVLVLILIIVLNGYVWIYAISRNYLSKNLLQALRTE